MTAFLALALAILPAHAAKEVRERWDGAGHVVHRMVLVDGTLSEEAMFAGDAGRLVRKETIAGHATTVET